MGTAVDRRTFRRASWVNVIGNALKIIVEGAAGLAFGSVALVADAAHSIADLVASVVVLIWGDSRFEGPDEDHPHGHARIEPLTALFVGAVIILLGAYLLYESALGLLEGSEVVFSYVLVGALLFAMADMYLVYWYTMRANADLESTALRALAVDCLNDLYTTTAALVGVIGIALGYAWFDALAGALVSLLVIYQGLEIGRENLTYLSGKAAPADRQQELESTLLAHPGVEGFHDLRVFYDGTVLEVEVHVEVDGDMPLRDAHDLETDLIEMLRAETDVGDAHVHLDPSGIGEWKDHIDEPLE